jgi:hypothetical protein
MQLTPNFSLAELTVSETAARLGINNEPTPDVLANLRKTATMLEMVRSLVGKPVIVTSGYRSPELNRAVPGSSPRSAHTIGAAADFHVDGMSPIGLCLKISGSHILYDQCIHEFDSWTHLAWMPFGGGPARRQDLTINRNGTVLGFA